MLNWRTGAFGCAMLLTGYLLGVAGGLPAGSVHAQNGAAGPGEDAVTKIRAAHTALNAAMDALKAEGRYEGITNAPNAFLIMSGGGNAREDLESGRGVDPETFAALYANQALPEIEEQLSRDDQNRITFNNEVVRMYARSRLERTFAERLQITELAQ